MTGVFCSQEDIENFIQEVIVFEQMLKHKPFVITGVYNYEGIMNEFRVEYDELVSSFDSWPAEADYGDENISGYMQSYNSGYNKGFTKGYIARLQEEDTECDAD